MLEREFSLVSVVAFGAVKDAGAAKGTVPAGLPRGRVDVLDVFVLGRRTGKDVLVHLVKGDSRGAELAGHGSTGTLIQVGGEIASGGGGRGGGGGGREGGRG